MRERSIETAIGRSHVFLRLLAAIGGSYFCTASLASGAARLAATAGMPRSEAVYLMAMLGLLAYLAAALWAFSEPRLWRVWLVMLSGTLGGWLLRSLLAAMGIQ